MARAADPDPPTTRLSPAALAFRTAHAAIAVGFLAAIGDVWLSALTRRRGPLLRFSVGALVAEGIVVTANGGDCPLGGLQNQLGDPVPLFELVLPPRAARLAIPTLGGFAAVGIVLLARRPALAVIPSGPPSGHDARVVPAR